MRGVISNAHGNDYTRCDCNHGGLKARHGALGGAGSGLLCHMEETHGTETIRFSSVSFIVPFKLVKK